MLPPSVTSFFRTEPFKYTTRLINNFKEAEKRQKNKYSTVSEDEKMCYRHAFSTMADSYVQTYGTSFTWRSSIKKCIAKLLPGILTFSDATAMNCYVEYAFDINTKVCFHRFIADRDTASLAKGAARGSYLLSEMKEEGLLDYGTWQVQGESI